MDPRASSRDMARLDRSDTKQPREQGQSKYSGKIVLFCVISTLYPSCASVEILRNMWIVLSADGKWKKISR